MLRALRSVWIWAATAALVLAWVPLMGAVRLFDREPRLRTARWFRRLGRAVAKLNPWRLNISGQENLKPGERYVIVSNHQSLADIPLISHLKVDAKWLVKAELFRVPVFGWMLRMAEDVPVERKDRAKGAKALLECARYLRQGCSIVCFPEGTRSRDGQLGAFAQGPFQLAIRENRPVLPLVVEGSGAALPRNTWIFGGTRDIRLNVLESVSTDGLTAPQSGALRDAVQRKIAEELQRMRA
ncbi:MAG: 1-acyl-sn-glycerol-3-phosphate acyltransferase [Acidobacteriia bacterium]|nr:1-acyl-sn-glycerol-3-phosphate acyltransferase [Terriglobia bacterium]